MWQADRTQFQRCRVLRLSNKDGIHDHSVGCALRTAHQPLKVPAVRQVYSDTKSSHTKAPAEIKGTDRSRDWIRSDN